MSINQLISLYPFLSFQDRLTISMRMAFCIKPITRVLEEYIPDEGLIIDLGCGYGILSHLLSLSHPARNLIGVDMASKRIEIARSSEVNNRNAMFFASDIRNFDIPSCKAILIVDVLYMLPYNDQEKLLTSCYGKIGNNGLMIIKDTCKKPYWKYAYTRIEESIKIGLRLYGKEAGGKLYYRGAQDFKELLNRIGFRTEVLPLKTWLPYPGVFFVCHK